MSKPTLTIAVPCPTCGGKQLVQHWARHPTTGLGFLTDSFDDCPDCTDGTIRQAVSCAGCKWLNRGECENLVAGNEDQVWPLLVESDWGCLSWEVPE